jgi:hypothetical protein
VRVIPSGANPPVQHRTRTRRNIRICRKSKTEREPLGRSLFRRSCGTKISISNDLYRTVIIAVIAVRMVQMTGDEIIDMIAVWNGFVTAAGSMNVSSIMSGAAMVGRASIRILAAHVNRMFVHVVAVRMMKVAIVDIIQMVAVADGNVAAVRSMHVIVIGVMRKIATGHFDSFP